MLVGDQQNGLLYIGNNDRTEINAVDPVTQETVDTIIPPLSNAFYNNFDVDPALHRLYIFEEAGVLVYDTDTDTQIDFFSAPGTVAFSTPKGLVVPATHHLILFFGGYPTNCATATILDSNGGTVTTVPNLCGDYKESALSPDGLTLYSLASSLLSPNDDLHVYDLTNGTMTSVTLPAAFSGIGVNSKNGLVYLVEPPGRIYTYDPSDGAFDGPFDVGDFGTVGYDGLGVNFDAGKNQLLIRSSDQLTIVNTNTMTTVNGVYASVPGGYYQKPAILTPQGCGGGATGPANPCSEPAYAFFASNQGSVGYWTRYNPTLKTEETKAIKTEGITLRDIRYTAADPVLGKVYATSDTHNFLAYYSNGEWDSSAIGYALGRPVVNTANHLVYVPALGLQEIHVFDGISNESLPDITLNGSPVDVAVDPDGNRLFAATFDEIEVRSVQGAYLFSIPAIAHRVKANPCNGDLYAAIDNEIRVYDGKTGDLKRTLDIDALYFDIDTGTNQLVAWTRGQRVEAHDLCSGETQWEDYRGIPDNVVLGLTVDPVNHLAYFANDLSTTVDVYSMADGDILDHLFVEGLTSDAAVLACGGGCRLCCDPCAGATGAGICTITGYAYALQNDDIALIDPNTHQETGSFSIYPGNPSAFAVNPSDGMFYVATGNGVQVFDAQGGNQTSMGSGFTFDNVAYNPAANKIYAARYDGELYIYEAEFYGELDAIQVEPEMHLAVDPVTNQVYAAGLNSGIYVIDGATNAVETILPAVDLYAMAIDPTSHRLYAAIGTAGDVHIINTQTNTDEGSAITLPSGNPMGIAVNPNTNWLYANYGYNVKVVDISDSNTVDTIGAANITALTIDPVSNQVYLFSGGSETEIFDGRDNSLLGVIPMAGVVGYAFDTQKVCGGGGCSIFVAGGQMGMSNMSGLSTGNDIEFVSTPIVLGNDVTALDAAHFQVTSSGIYEISLRLAIDRSASGDYHFAYHLLINGNTEEDKYYREWNRIENQATMSDFTQLFLQLQANDVVSVRIVDYTSDNKGYDYLSSFIAIRKLC